MFAIFAWIIQIVDFTLLRTPFWIFTGPQIMWRHVKTISMISYKSVESVDILSKIPPYWKVEGKHGWKEIGKRNREKKSGIFVETCFIRAWWCLVGTNVCLIHNDKYMMVWQLVRAKVNWCQNFWKWAMACTEDFCCCADYFNLYE